MYSLFLILFVSISLGINFETNQLLPIKETVRSDSVNAVSLSAVGDIMCHSTQFKFAKVNEDSFDFKPVYQFIRPYLSQADITVGNLETVFAGKKNGYKGYPVFNTPDDFLEGLKFAGFDLLYTANNHVLDQGSKGITRTLEKIKYNYMESVGTNLSEKGKNYKIINKNGLKIAFLAYSYSLNGFSISSDKNYMINSIDKEKITRDIKLVKNDNPDVILVYYHFGNEYEKSPSPYQRDVVQFTINAGVDIIIASHPHVMQPVEFFKTKGGNLDSGFVAYSLGNFISNQRWRYSDASVILNFEISKNLYKDSVYLSDVSYLPLWVYKGEYKGKNSYLILPSEISLEESTPEFLSRKDLELMKESYYDTQNIICGKSKKLRLGKFRDKKLAYPFVSQF